MGHHPPREGHPFPHHGQPGVDSESEGHESPRTPGTPTFLRPPAGRKAPKELEHDPRHAVQRGLVDYNLQSPISPSRPKSPWGRFDPYDSSEVMPGNQELALTQREADGHDVMLEDTYFTYISNKAHNLHYCLGLDL
uniref:Uncharacterized protein n=1 Tax=Astyanax mexicanus TaxID=7994 RepID=A0A3B1JPV7_ASTMX